MKEGWEYKTLGEVGSFKRGGNFSKKDFVKDGFPCIHYGQIHTKFGIYTEKHLCCVPANIVKKERCAKKGDLVIAITSEDEEGSCKCTAWMADYEAYVGGHTAIYSHTLNPLFMSYYFKSPIFQTEKLNYTHGFKVVEISPKDIAKIIIPVPSLDEQRRIVSYLDSSFKLIDEIKNKALKSLTEAKALFQSALAEAMEPKEGWEEKTLGELCSIIGGGTPSKKNSSYYNGDIPWATVSDMNCDYLQNTICKISDDGVKNSSTQIISKNEVIIATRVGLGKVCILCQDTAINQDLKGIIPKSDNKLIRKFIFWWFRSKSNYIVSNGVGATVKGVKLSFVSNLKMSLPTISTQKRIVSHLDSLSSKVRAIEEKYQKMVEECDALKQAMLRDVFE